jgi:hypothetical protein
MSVLFRLADETIWIVAVFEEPVSVFSTSNQKLSRGIATMSLRLLETILWLNAPTSSAAPPDIVVVVSVVTAPAGVFREFTTVEPERQLTISTASLAHVVVLGVPYAV